MLYAVVLAVALCGCRSLACPGVVEASEVRVLDSSGQTRIVIGQLETLASGAVPGIRFLGANGSEKILLSVEESGVCVLRMRGEDGAIRASLSVGVNGWTKLDLCDESGNIRSMVGVDIAGRGRLVLRGADGLQVLDLPGK